MATRVIHEHEATSHDNGVGLIVGITLLVVFLLFMWFAFTSGAFRGLVPSGGTNIQVPDRIDVNLNQGSQGR
jgi:hypothetical protein